MAGVRGLPGSPGRRTVYVPALGKQGNFAPGWTADLPDRYDIVREHGRGGMATVYLATDRKHDRPVALKILAPELAAGIGAERFVREIQIAAHLNHPHIVPLLDSGIVEGRPFYVMPFLEGETLRERLEREGPLPIGEALRIAHDVAEALVHAHAREVIHRDVKPGNILLTAGSAVVTDFGIASALDKAPEEHLTRTGLSVGTAGYMSPEQATGDEEVDGRADQYSLACVLYEMLAGHPPFTGHSARQVLGRQLSEAVPAISLQRENVPEGLDEVLERALAREPSERFPSSQALANALDELAHRAAAAGLVPRARTRPAMWVALLVAVAFAVASWFVLWSANLRLPHAAAVSVDTTRYAVFPFEYGSGVEEGIQETLLLEDALARWDGISTVHAGQLGEAIVRTGEAALSTEDASRVARELGAGRFFVGRVAGLADSLRIDARLLEVTSDSSKLIGRHSIRLARQPRLADSAFSALVENLLWGGDPPPYARIGVGTSSFPALRSFAFGMRAVEAWDLALADSGFSSAAEWDGEYAQAHLWTALVRAWNGDEPASWQIPAHQARLRSERMSKRDAAMAEAIARQAEGAYETACPRWRQISVDHPSDFASWYGLATCLRADRFVVPSEESPSAWSFRSGPAEALRAYRRAFLRLPSILQTFRAEAFRPLRDLLQISGAQYSIGLSAGDSLVFYAFPSWQGDTLAYVPRPGMSAFLALSDREMNERAKALTYQRRVFREIATTWVAAAPRSGPAREALAIAMALDREPSALDTLRRARELGGGPADSVRMAGLHVWLQLVFALPDDAAEIDAAGQRADSLLAAGAADVDPLLASSLAALLGRGLLAARLIRLDPPVDPEQIPSPLHRDASALLVFAALGGPMDSLEHLTERVMDGVSQLPARDRTATLQWMGMPASMAFSEHPLPATERFSADWLVAAQLALRDGDTTAVLRTLTEALDDQRRKPAYAITFDALRPVAELWLAAGSPEGAVAALEPALRGLPAISPDLLYLPYEIASLVRTAGLRAQVARAQGSQSEAATWSRAAALLWSDADPFLHPLIRRIQEVHEPRIRTDDSASITRRSTEEEP